MMQWGDLCGRVCDGVLKIVLQNVCFQMRSVFQGQLLHYPNNCCYFRLSACLWIVASSFCVP